MFSVQTTVGMYRVSLSDMCSRAESVPHDDSGTV